MKVLASCRLFFLVIPPAFFSLAGFLFFHLSAALAEMPADLPQSRIATLASHPTWLKLIQYRRPDYFFGGLESLIDAPDFFLSPEGKTDPEAELRASIEALLSAQPGEDSVWCRYPRRTRWLSAELPEIFKQHNPANCSEFEAWKAGMQAQQLTLVFPAAYLNNPASMFGHTFLRLDAPEQDEKTRLLAYGASFGAATGSDGGALFAIKGLLGGYQASFSIDPYYKLVKKYSDIEHRDIWEYTLSFTPEETEQIIEYLWELGHTSFDYFFFDENCSYYLLALMEIAREKLSLASEYTLWAIPADTVRSVVNSPGLVQSTVFRPSHATKLKARLLGMSDSEIELGKEIVDEERIPESLSLLTAESKVRVLEFAFDYLEYKSAKQSDPSAKSRALGRELLVKRSELDLIKSEPLLVPVPEVRPDQGHETARAVLGAGAREGEAFSELELRLAYHDLMDSPAGYTLGAAIEFFSARLRQYEEHSLNLIELTPVRIRSVTPWNKLFRPLSWNIEGGLLREQIPRNGVSSEPLGKMTLRLEGGTGVSAALGDKFTAAGFFQQALSYASAYADTDFAGGFGPQLFTSYDIDSSNRLFLEAKHLRFALGENYSKNSLGLTFHHAFSTEHAVRFSVSRASEHGEWWSEGMLKWLAYF